MAWDELACIFAGSKDKEEVNKVISTFARKKNNRFSYEYIDVGERWENCRISIGISSRKGNEVKYTYYKKVTIHV